MKVLDYLINLYSEPVFTTLRTLYNSRQKIKKRELDGKDPIEALIWEIRKSSLFHKINNIDGKTYSLFIAHPYSILLARQFPTLFLMHCTYKTNKLKMPLLHICGINNCNKSFSVAFLNLA